MKSRLFIAGLVIVGMCLLSGCTFLDGIIDAITGAIDSITGGGTGTGGGSGTGGGTGTTVVSGRMEFHLYGNINQRSGGTSPGTIGTTFWSGAGSYNPTTRIFTATWNGGDFSNTFFEAKVSANHEFIEHFYARQTQANVWGAWTFVHEIEGDAILFSHDYGNSKYFIVDGSDARAIVTTLVYKSWSNAIGGPSDPVDWVTGPGALTGDTGDVIQIRLDYN